MPPINSAYLKYVICWSIYLSKILYWWSLIKINCYNVLHSPLYIWQNTIRGHIKMNFPKWIHLSKIHQSESSTCVEEKKHFASNTYGPSWSWSYGGWIYNYLCNKWNVVSSNPVHGEVYSIQYYVIKFVSDLRQVGCFLLVLRFPHQ